LYSVKIRSGRRRKYGLRELLSQDEQDYVQLEGGNIPRAKPRDYRRAAARSWDGVAICSLAGTFFGGGGSSSLAASEEEGYLEDMALGKCVTAMCGVEHPKHFHEALLAFHQIDQFSSF
jgi:hypothetical protein